MFNKKIILLFLNLYLYLLFLFQIFNVSKCIEIISSSIVKKEVNVLGVDLSYALIDVEFDKDIYLYDSLGCPNFVCTPPTNTNVDCSCDYTDYNDCPKTKGRDSSCPPCPKETQFFDLPPADYCTSTNWTTVQFDKEYTFSTSETMFLRVKANPFGCRGVFLKTFSIEGFGQVFFGASPVSSETRYSSIALSSQRNVVFNICPSDNWSTPFPYAATKSWTRDTYFIRVDPQTPTFKFSLILHSNDVPSEPVNTSGCVPATVNHTCITTGQIVVGKFSNQKPKYYSYKVTTPGFYYFNFPSIDQTTFALISTTNPFPGNTDYNIILNQNYENNLVLKLKPISDTEPLIVYITIGAVLLTDFTFSVTTQGDRYKYSLASVPSPQSGALSLVNSARIVLPNKLAYDQPIYYSSNLIFSNLYPTSDLNPLWPVPAFFYDSNKFNYKLITNNVSMSEITFKPKSFQAAFIISSGDTTYQTFDTILNSKLEFLSNLFDQDDNILDFSVGFKEKQLECENNEFQKQLKLIEQTQKTLFNVSDMDELNNYRYSLDSLTMNNAWVGCSNKALALLEVETVTKQVSQRYCPYKDTDPEYYTNPCCYNFWSYYECCNPTLISINVTQYTKPDNVLVKEQCSSLNCTSSVLSEYANVLSNIDECAVPDSEPTKYELSATNVLRQCKSVLNSPICNNDQDCNDYGAKVCNLYSRTCLPNYNIIDREYVKCVLTNLAPGTLFSLLGGSTNVDNTVIDTVFNNHLKDDCTGYQNIQDRSTYTWVSSRGDERTRCYLIDDCLDESCLTHHDICLDSVYDGWRFLLESGVGNCANIGVCPFLECQDNTATVNGVEKSCKEACDETSSGFCGYCTNDVTQCHVANEIKNITDCQAQQNLCLLPNGEYVSSTSEQDCNSKGHCTVPCGYECVSSFPNSEDDICVIISTEMDTETKCATLNNATNPTASRWSNETKTCIYNLATTSQQCTSMGTGYSWIDCSSKAYGECAGAVGRVDLCQLSPIECQSESECLQVGSCTDQYYFNPITSNNANYNFGQGKCLFKHNFYQYGFTCRLNSLQNDSPNGCYWNTPKQITKATCEAAKGEWWVPATNENQCTSQMGCKILEDPTFVNNLPYNYYFNEMTQDLCEGCIDSFNQWTNKFEWTNAKWIPGIYKPTQWLTGKSFIPNVVVDVFNYQLFYNSVIKAAKTQVADLFRSEAYCRMERLQSNLNSITCSCSGEGGSQCFAESTPLLGQTKPCAGASSTFTFDYGKIEFLNNSIDQSCQMLSVSQISREIYASTEQESLASNFVSYQKPDNYGVLNSKRAIVGTLLSDGIMIKSQSGVNIANVCFTISFKKTSKYPVYDFAIHRDNESYPTPLQAENISFNETTNLLCSRISNIPSGNPTLFPINRFNEWENESRQVFDSTSRALMYTLAALFLAVTLWGLFEICLIVYGKIKYREKIKKKFQLTHLLISVVTIFIMIRAIYFFILPSGHLSDSPVSDYILVVLPTFIYFTAFNILLVLWYVIVFLVLKKNNSADNLSKRLFKIVITINTCLYLLFIAIVLVFQYTKSTPSNDCGSRLVVSIESSTPQRVVSIVYAVIQAVISLIMGAAFIYLGGSLYMTMRNTKISIGSKSNHQRKIFILSFVCSIGFLLHCVFVLILVAGNVNSMIFSFIGLVITELIPAISILYCFDQKKIDTDSGTARGFSTKGNNNNNSKSGSNSGGGNNSNNNSGNAKLSTFISESRQSSYGENLQDLETSTQQQQQNDNLHDIELSSTNPTNREV